MDIEQAAEKTVEQGKSTIQDAQMLMAMMSALRGKLNIKDGAGRRFLQKIKPENTQLQQAEKEITSNYSDSAGTSKPKKRQCMMNALARHGRL